MRHRLPRRRSGVGWAGAALLLWVAACGDSDSAGPAPPANRPPQAVGRISDLILPKGETASVDLGAYFSDPEQGALRYAVSTSDGTVVAAAVSGGAVTLTAVSAGHATIIVTATDSQGLAVQQVFSVAVPAPPVVEVVAAVATVAEGDEAVLDLVLSTPPPTPIRVAYTLGVDGLEETNDADAADVGGAASGAVEIAAGAGEASIKIQIADDDDIEPTREIFTLTLDEPAADDGYEVGPRTTAAVTILEGVCDRTTAVAEEIARSAGVAACAEVEDRHLSAILTLRFGFSQAVARLLAAPHAPTDTACVGKGPFSMGTTGLGRGLDGSAACARGGASGVKDAGSGTGDAGDRPAEPTAVSGGGSRIAAFKRGDFAGLRNLNVLAIANSEFTELPAGLFAGLENLETLAVVWNQLTTLPAAIFADLRRLNGLFLSGNRLDSLPDDAFAGLADLRVLYADDNRIARLPSSLSGLASLEFLALSRNGIAHLPDESSGLRSLQTLALSFNQLTDVPATWLQGSPGLRELYLDNNRLETVPAGAFAGMTELAELHLWFNRLRELPDGVFADLAGLKRLMLARNELTTVTPATLAGLSGLEWLALDGNKLSDLPENLFADLGGLRRLWLSSNGIEALAAGMFAPLDSLRLLALAENDIAHIAEGTFSGLGSLETLWLIRNRLAELPPGLLSGLERLEDLHLSENLLGALPARMFSGLTGLRNVSLQDNPGAPFALTVVIERVDDEDLLAPGPATVSPRLAQGAPFALRIPLSVRGGGLGGGGLGGDAVVIAAGEERGSRVAVTGEEGGGTGTQVSAGPAPLVPYGFTGLVIAVGNPIVLFDEVSNRAPFASNEIPWQRLRAGADGETLTASAYFRDPDGDALEYTAWSEDPHVATVTATESRITVMPKSGGSTTATVSARDGGGLAVSLSFAVYVRDAIAGSFDIDVVFTDSVSAPHRAAVREAADWWMTILAGMELPDVPTDQLGRLGCGGVFAEERVGEIDELVIVAAIREFDGPGGILGAAQPCAVREASMLPFVGVMRIDVEDLALLELDDQRELILHEMGHVLGIGSLWHSFDLLRNPSIGADGSGADTHFAGPLAIAAFDDAGGTAYAEGEKVPVENRAGPGSGDVHWRQSVMRTELMTPYATIGAPDPLSAITIQSLADLGYVVDVSVAEPYALPIPAAAVAEEPDVIYLGDDVLKDPIIIVDRDGRVTGVIGG